MKGVDRYTEAQVRDYLERIGWFEGHACAPEASAAHLDALIWLHQTHVPFENTDARIRRVPASLDADDLFRKIVVERRGGICYELNAAFHSLLVSLGFDAVPVFARNMRNLAPGAPMPISHRGELVRFADGARYVDVGYGGPVAGCSLPVSHDATVLNAGRWFRISRSVDEDWWQLSTASAACSASAACPAVSCLPPADDCFEPVLLFCDRAAREEDFVPFCWHATTCPDSVFTRLLFLNLRTETGNASVRGNVFTVVDGTDKRTSEVAEEEIARLAKELFGL